MRSVFGAAVAAAMVACSAVGANAQSGGYVWQGPYVGGNLGYQSGAVSNNPTRPSGGEFGIQGGYSWQSGRFVFGTETDMQVSGADDVFAPWKFSNPWFGTLRGRGGVTFNNILLYGTAGLAYGALRAQSTTTGIVESKSSLGWAAGAGVEVGLASNWRARAEYLYIDLSDRPYSVTGANHGLATSLLRMGVNYRF
jgi:outer membrane immunogenic protein